MPLLALIFCNIGKHQILMLYGIAMNNRSPEVRDREGNTVSPRCYYCPLAADI